MPRKATKRLQVITEAAIKIRCRYCDIKETCDRRIVKEQYEGAGFMTRCTLTPNQPKKKKK